MREIRKKLKTVLEGYAKFLRDRDLAPVSTNHTWYDGCRNSSCRSSRAGILVFTLRISVSPSLPLPMPACQNTTAETCKHANGSLPHLKALPCEHANVLQAAGSGV